MAAQTDLIDEVGRDVRQAVDPVRSAVRSDVGRLGAFLRGIQSTYLIAGLVALLVAAVSDVVVTVTGGFNDWYMHLAMYGSLLVVILLYIRAFQRGFRIVGPLWALGGIGLLGFFAWVLVDRIPARLQVTAGRDGLEVAMRAEAPLLWVPASLLALVALWLALHWAVMGRLARRRQRAAASPASANANTP